MIKNHFDTDRPIPLTLVGLLALLTAACGGGGSSDDPSAVDQSPVVDDLPVVDGPAWYPSEGLREVYGSNAQHHQVEMDSNGNAIAVWSEINNTVYGSVYHVWASRYEHGIGWSTPRVIDDSATNAFWPEVKFDKQGNALVVWAQDSNTWAEIWAARYDVTTGWSAPELIKPETLSRPQLAVEPDGTATILWTDSITGGEAMYAARFVPDSGWSSPELMHLATDSGEYGPSSSMQLANNGSGNLIAVWHERYNGIMSVYATRYVAGVGWGTAQLLENDDTGSAANPQIDMNASGDAVVIWEQHDGTESNIYSARYVEGDGWKPADLVEISGGNATSPRIGMDSRGNAIAAWQQETRLDGQNDVWVNRYTAGIGWGLPTLDAVDATNYGQTPNIVVEDSGDAFLVWEYYNPNWLMREIMANHYTSGIGWGVPELLQKTDGDGNLTSPQIAVDDNGNASVIWLYRYKLDHDMVYVKSFD